MPTPSTFALTLGQLQEIRDALSRRIIEGLSAPDREIRALPAYLGRPRGPRSGEAVALDTGGSKIRAARIRFEAAAPRQDRLSRSDVLLSARTPGRVTDRRFFDEHAALVEKTCAGAASRIGWCFSYPATITPDGDAVLIKWTKGLRIDHVVGTPVGRRLAAVLRERGRVRPEAIPVLNDTVASLLAAALLAPNYEHYIGLIVGTGTNMAGYFPVKRITKLAPAERAGWDDDEDMAVNLESGNFTPPYLTACDDAVDAAMPEGQRGDQRFEKAVSGEFLPRLFESAIASETGSSDDFGLDAPETDADPRVARLAGLRDHPAVGAVATALLDRSADLAAAALAGLIGVYQSEEGHEAQKNTVGILAEGSVLKTPRYVPRMTETLRPLVPPNVSVEFIHSPAGVDANLLGAACAALLRSGA
jgi:hexokinase